MKLSSTEKKMRTLDYIKGFLFKVKDLNFTEVHAAHEVAEWVQKEYNKLERRMVRKGKFDNAGEFRQAYKNGIKNKDEWMKAQGISVDDFIKDNNLEEFAGDAGPTDSAIEARMKAIDAGEKI